MFEGEGNPRRLPFPLLSQVSNENTTDDAGQAENEFVWPEDPTERTVFPLWISQQEFTALGSAIDVGADIAYPLQYVAIMWLWMRNARYGVNICQLIQECIEASPGVQQALRDFVVSDSAINRHINDIAEAKALTAGQRGQSLLKPNTCGNDFLFSQASQMVFLLNQVSEDIFEALEVETNTLERAQLLVSAIPAVGGFLPFDEILSLADTLVDNVREEYLGAYNQVLYDETRCDLFCYIQEDCSMSIDDAISFYEEQLAQSVPQDPLEAFVFMLQFVATGNVPGSVSVYAMHLIVLSAIRLSQNVFGLNFGSLGLRITAAGNDADPDWEILCEDCAPEERVPVIAIPDGQQSGGIITGPDVNGVYTATSTARTFDDAITIMDEQGRDFRIAIQTLNTTPACTYWYNPDNSYFQSCGSGNVYPNGQLVKALGFTYQLAITGEITFTIAP